MPWALMPIDLGEPAKVQITEGERTDQLNPFIIREVVAVDGEITGLHITDKGETSFVLSQWLDEAKTKLRELRFTTRSFDSDTMSKYEEAILIYLLEKYAQIVIENGQSSHAVDEAIDYARDAEYCEL